MGQEHIFYYILTAPGTYSPETLPMKSKTSRRLDKNATAVDVLNSNRRLWLTAGGPEPDLLQNPTEMLIDHCTKTVLVLQSMLQKHGPQGGLDSFVQERLCV